MRDITSDVEAVIHDKTLTYHQQLLALARIAENEDTTLKLNPEFIEALNDRCICDLNEGHAPYRPRYIAPDYTILMEKGCKFLELEKPKSLLEACNNLLIFYKHVPSVTSFPVYLGNFTEMFREWDDEADLPITKEILRCFLKNIDKTLCDSFVHANIGPKDSKITRVILDLTEEMQLAIPNLTLLYDEDITPRDLALRCVKCMLKTSKPSFANHKMYSKEHESGNYCIVSCYNALEIGGGGYTLPRLRLFEIAKKSNGVDDFFSNILPKYVGLILDDIDRRIKFIVENSQFFEANFLVKEGFVEREKFTGMVGVVGVAEASNYLLGITDKAKGYGNNEEANKMGEKILDEIEKMVKAHHGLYCSKCNNNYVMHAQVGIDTDKLDDSPGCRVPIGFEPPLYKHIELEAKMHRTFVSGVGDIFKFDQTWSNSLDAVLDIINGALRSGMRYFTAYNEDNDVVRVTGYLVKKSEIEKLRKGEQSLNNVTIFGKGADEGAKALDRRVYNDRGD